MRDKEKVRGYNKNYAEKHKAQLLEYQSQYRANHRESLRLKSQKARETIGNKCIDCGKSITPYSIRCKSCASKAINNATIPLQQVGVWYNG